MDRSKRSLRRSTKKTIHGHTSAKISKSALDSSVLSNDSMNLTDLNCSDSGSPASVDIPDVNERLAYLRPSRQLLEFYRKKIGQYDGEHDQMVKKLEEYKQGYEEQHKLEWEMRQREDEIAELQKALSDMQVFLFQEREQVLRLYSENDRYKIKDLESKRTIQQLLALNGGAQEGEVSYFFKEPPEKPIIPNKTNFKNTHQQRGASAKQASQQSGKLVVDKKSVKTKEDGPDKVTLSLQIEALQSQLEEQTRWAKEHIEALMEDRRIKGEENETRRDRDVDKVKTVTTKLHKTQDLLYISTQDILQLRNEFREGERRWMIEKDKLLRELDTCRDQINMGKPEQEYARKVVLNVSNNATDQTFRYKQEIKKLREELEGSHRMSDMYREQVISLEDELARFREKEDLKQDAYQEKTQKMGKRYEIMKARYEDLEKRRNLEVEGFQNDIKALRKRLKEMEKQLYKATVGMGDSLLPESRPADIDLAVLRNVRKTAGRSSKISGDLKGLKARMYNLENDMKHL